jgi:DNA replication factor GINS
MVTAVRDENEEAGEAKNNNNNNNELLSIKDIYNLLLKEIQISTLQSIPTDTYQRVAAMLGNLRGQGYEGVEAKIRDNMTELISTSAKLLLETRYQKLMKGRYKGLSSSSLPVMIAVVDYSNLTDEEKYILDGEKESEKRKISIYSATLKGRSKVLESISAKLRSKQITVRFLKPMEQFMGVDMKKYGPFQQEDVAVLPIENARSLIDNGEVVEVY